MAGARSPYWRFVSKSCFDISGSSDRQTRQRKTKSEAKEKAQKEKEKKEKEKAEKPKYKSTRKFFHEDEDFYVMDAKQIGKWKNFVKSI